MFSTKNKTPKFAVNFQRPALVMPKFFFSIVAETNSTRHICPVEWLRLEILLIFEKNTSPSKRTEYLYPKIYAWQKWQILNNCCFLFVESRTMIMTLCLRELVIQVFK